MAQRKSILIRAIEKRKQKKAEEEKKPSANPNSRRQTNQQPTSSKPNPSPSKGGKNTNLPQKGTQNDTSSSDVKTNKKGNLANGLSRYSEDQQKDKGKYWAKKASEATTVAERQKYYDKARKHYDKANDIKDARQTRQAGQKDAEKNGYQAMSGSEALYYMNLTRASGGNNDYVRKGIEAAQNGTFVREDLRVKDNSEENATKINESVDTYNSTTEKLDKLAKKANKALANGDYDTYNELVDKYNKLYSKSEKQYKDYEDSVNAYNENAQAFADMQTKNTYANMGQKLASGTEYSINSSPVSMGFLQGVSFVPVSMFEATQQQTGIDLDRRGIDSKAYQNAETVGAIAGALAGGKALGTVTGKGWSMVGNAIMDAPSNAAMAQEEAGRQLAESKKITEGLDTGGNGLDSKFYNAENEAWAEPDSNGGKKTSTESKEKWNENLYNYVMERYADENGNLPDNIQFKRDKNDMLHYSASGHIDDVIAYYDNAENPTYTLNGVRYSGSTAALKKFGMYEGMSAAGGLLGGGKSAKKAKDAVEEVAENATKKEADDVAETVVKKSEPEEIVKVEEKAKPPVKTQSQATQKTTVKGKPKKEVPKKEQEKDFFLRTSKEDKAHEAAVKKADRASELADNGKKATSDESASMKDFHNQNVEINKKYADTHEAKVKEVEEYISNYDKRGVDHVRAFDQDSEINGGVPTQGGSYRVSQNEPWYREFYNKHGRPPRKNEIHDLAEQIVKDAENGTTGQIDVDFKDLVKARTDADDYATALNDYHKQYYPDYSDAEFELLKRTGLEKSEWTPEMKKALRSDSSTKTKVKAKKKVTPELQGTPTKAQEEVLNKYFNKGERASEEINDAIGSIRQETKDEMEKAVKETGKVPQELKDKAIKEWTERWGDRTSADFIKKGTDEYVDFLEEYQSKAVKAKPKNSELPKTSVGADKNREAMTTEELLNAHKYSLRVKTSDGRVKVIDVPALTPSEAKAKLKERGYKVPRQKAKDKGLFTHEQRFGTGVPEKTELGDVQEGASNVINSRAVNESADPEEARKAIIKGVENGDFYKPVITNKSVIESAEKAVSEDVEAVEKEFNSLLVEGKRTTSEDIAKGERLAAHYGKQGDYDKMEQILADTCTIASESGRTLQAMRIFNQLSPEGRMRNLQNQVRKIEKQTGQKVTIDKGLRDAVIDAATDEERVAANKAFAKHIWDQIPPTFMEKVNTWRYLSMLFNPKTHIRNALGNAMMLPLRTISDGMAFVGEKAFASKIDTLSAGEVKGTKAMLTLSKEDKDLMKLGMSQFKKHIASMEADSSKYFSKMRAEGSRTFSSKNKVLDTAGKGVDWVANLNSKALDKEDRWFNAINFTKAYAEYCKANGKIASQVEGKFADEALEYATRKGLEGVYREANDIADAINRWRKTSLKVKASDKLSTKALKKTGSLLADAALPFVNTPANILKQGIGYSPAGILHGAAQIATAKDAETLIKGIEHLSQGITGSGLMALGVWCANKEWVNGKLGDSRDSLTQFNKMLGSQDYAVTTASGKTITVDWIAPQSIPFFIGVEGAKSFSALFDEDSENNAGVTWGLIHAFGDAMAPVFNLSMLQGVENIFSASFSDDNTFMGFLENAASNYASQFVPTMLGQVARTTADSRMTTMALGDDKLQRQFDKAVDKIVNKIPGWNEKRNQPYVDLWGRTDDNENKMRELAENMFYPAYVQTDNSTDVDKKLLKLAENLGEDDVKEILPKWTGSEYDVAFNEEHFKMTESEYTKFKQDVGQLRYKNIEKLMSSKKWKKLSDDEKVKEISQIYKDANAYGKERFLVDGGHCTQEEYDYTLLSDKQKAMVDDGKVKATEIRKSMKLLNKHGVSSGDSDTREIVVLLKEGYSQKKLSKLGYNTTVEYGKKGGIKENAYTRAVHFNEMGYDYEKAYAEMNSKKAKKYDANNNGSLNIEETKKYLDTEHPDWSKDKRWAYLYGTTGVSRSRRGSYGY